MGVIPEKDRVLPQDVCRFAVYGKPQLQTIPDHWSAYSTAQRWTLMQHMQAAMVSRLIDHHSGEAPSQPAVGMFSIPLVHPPQSRTWLRELLQSPIEASCMLQREATSLHLVLRMVTHTFYGAVVVDCIYPLVEETLRVVADPSPAFHLVQPPGCLFVDAQGQILGRDALTRRIPRIYAMQYAWVYEAFVLPFCDSHQILMANQWFHLKISLSQKTVTIGPGNEDIH